MLHDILHALNQAASQLSTGDLVVIAGVLATGIQYLVNKYRDLGRLENWLLSLPLPFFATLGVFLPVGNFSFAKGAFAYMAAQVLYLTFSEVSRRARKDVTVQATAGLAQSTTYVPAATTTATTGTNF